MAAKKTPSVTDDQIRAIRAKAEEAGDRTLVKLCNAAPRGEQKAWKYVVAAAVAHATPEPACPSP